MLVQLTNGFGFPLVPSFCFPLDPITSLVSALLDAAGEELAMVGRVYFKSGPGTSKVISSAGGKIHFATGTVTFADAASTLRVGIQDVGATGFKDGTYDVNGDYTSAAPPTASAINSKAMSTGTKTIAYGDLIAVVVEMVARGGTDSVNVSRSNAGSHFPYCTHLGAKVNFGPAVTIEFDDGTVGWLAGANGARLTSASSSFSSASTPDEHALIFRLPFRATVHALLARMGALAATDDYELILYADPLGTPKAERTVAQDMDLASTGELGLRLVDPYVLDPNVDYAVALRPTTTNAINYDRFTVSEEKLLDVTPLGRNWYLGTRTDQSGAFSVDKTVLPHFGLMLHQIDDGLRSARTRPYRS